MPFWIWTFFFLSFQKKKNVPIPNLNIWILIARIVNVHRIVESVLLQPICVKLNSQWPNFGLNKQRTHTHNSAKLSKTRNSTAIAAPRHLHSHNQNKREAEQKRHIDTSISTSHKRYTMYVSHHIQYRVSRFS